MSKYTAEFIGKVRDKNGYAVHLFYRYRGKEYMITDEHNGYSETMATKHKNEQDRIDSCLDNPHPTHSTEDAQVGFDKFWSYVNGDESAFDE